MATAVGVWCCYRAISEPTVTVQEIPFIIDQRSEITVDQEEVEDHRPSTIDREETEKIRNEFWSMMNATEFRGDPFSKLADITAVALDPTINYLIVGECDGYSGGSLEQYLFSDRVALGDWHGIMMEPVPTNFQRLQQFLDESKVHNDKIDRQILRINAAFSEDTEFEVVDHDKTITLNVADLEAMAKMAEANGKSLDDVAHWIKNQVGSVRDLGIFNRPGFKKETVPAMNAEDVHRALVEHQKVYERMDRGGIIDVLQVDTEGFDAVVVRNFVSWSKMYSVRPMFVQYEQKIVAQSFPEELKELKLFLEQHGYDCMDGGDSRCYLRTEQAM